MEIKYHVGENGPRRCEATIKKCRYADDGHYASLEAAQNMYSKKSMERLARVVKKAPPRLFKDLLRKKVSLISGSGDVLEYDDGFLVRGVVLRDNSPQSYNLHFEETGSDTFNVTMIPNWGDFDNYKVLSGENLTLDKYDDWFKGLKEKDSNCG